MRLLDKPLFYHLPILKVPHLHRQSTEKSSDEATDSVAVEAGA